MGHNNGPGRWSNYRSLQAFYIKPCYRVIDAHTVVVRETGGSILNIAM